MAFSIQAESHRVFSSSSYRGSKWMPRKSRCLPASLARSRSRSFLLSFRSARRKGFSRGRARPSSPRMSSLGPGVKKPLRKKKRKTRLRDPRLRKTSSETKGKPDRATETEENGWWERRGGGGVGGRVDRDGKKKERKESRHPRYRN